MSQDVSVTDLAVSVSKYSYPLSVLGDCDRDSWSQSCLCPCRLYQPQSDMMATDWLDVSFHWACLHMSVSRMVVLTFVMTSTCDLHASVNAVMTGCCFLRVYCVWECVVSGSVVWLRVCLCCVRECDVSESVMCLRVLCGWECCVRVVGLWCAMTVVASFIKSVLSTWVKYGRTSLSVTCACVRRMLRERRTNSLPSVSTSSSSRPSTTLTIYNYTFGMNWSYIMTNWCKTCMVCHQNWFVTFFDWHWTGFYIFLPDL